MAVGLAAENLAQLSNQLQSVLDPALIARILLLSGQIRLSHSDAEFSKLVVVAAANCEKAIGRRECLRRSSVVRAERMVSTW